MPRMKAAAVLARLFLCLAFVAGGGIASAFAETYSPELKQKAELGDAKAQYKLGAAYYYGRGVDKNKAAAVNWWSLAAEQGSTKAQLKLGVTYYYGHGVDKNLFLAEFYLRLAAEHGHTGVQGLLGYLYNNGRGFEQDYYEAYIWYALAGSTSSAEEMKAELTPKKIAEAEMEIKAKAKEIAQAKAEARTKARAKVEALYSTGNKHEEGDGVLPNHKEAARLYGFAAEKGHAGAQYRLGLMYLNGKGVAQDYGEAYILLALAALNADGGIKEKAAKNRQTVEEKLTSDELNQAQAEAAKRLEAIKAAAK